ncbi:MAG: nucleotidyltransferase domain-containing protein [Candidatus Bipolaricaulota bacterium]
MSSISLAGVLFSKTRAALLRELYAEPEGLHVRELERRTGFNIRNISRELHLLSAAGILTAKPVGRQVTYKMEPDCPIADEMKSIVRKTVGLVDVIRQALEPSRDRVDLAYIFGSFARGEERAGSDVDLMIVGGATRRELATPLREAAGFLRREINTVFYTAAEYARARDEEDSFVHRVHVGPRLDVLVGLTDEPGRHAPTRRDKTIAARGGRGKALR